MLFSLKAAAEAAALLIAENLAVPGAVFLSSLEGPEGLPWIRGFEPNQDVPPPPGGRDAGPKIPLFPVYAGRFGAGGASSD